MLESLRAKRPRGEVQDHCNAQYLATELSDFSQIEIDKSKVFTNIIFFKIKNDSISDNEFINKLNKKNILIDYKGSHTFRIVLHADINQEDINNVVKSFKIILK